MNFFQESALLSGIVFMATGIVALSLVGVAAARDYARARQAMKRIARIPSGPDGFTRHGG